MKLPLKVNYEQLAIIECNDFPLYHADGAPPSDVTVEQTGVSTVLVIWTAPSPPPTNGYQVQITRGSTTTTDNVAGTSYTKSSLQHGVYSIRVKSLSRHFPGEATEPVEITVRGTFLS